jgi:AbrB family looped-hinge helix DNA binding protein
MQDAFYGAVTVGERGQVVIPAEARRMMGVVAGDKLLVLGHPHGDGVILATIDALSRVTEDFRIMLERVQRGEHDGEA